MRILLVTGAALALLAAAAGGARADERQTTVTVGAVFGAQSSEHVPGAPPELQAQGFGGPRLTLAWEEAPLPYPARPGYAVDVGLVPELVAGAFLDDKQADGMIGVGLRGELRVSQREQGLLRISIRGVFYVTGRALVVGEQRDALGELVFGEYILVGRGGRFGFEVGGMARRDGAMDQSHAGIVGQLYLGWRL